MATLGKIPDRCLICYSEIGTDQRRPAIKGRGSGECSTIIKHLDTIFILSNLLEVPVQSLQTFLMFGGSPETWVTVCRKCEVMVEDTKRIHYEMSRALRRFKKLKGKVIEAVKQSEAVQFASREESVSITTITDQIRGFVSVHGYGDSCDPFLLGDRKANELIQKKLGKTSQFVMVEENLDKSNIKMEPDHNVDDPVVFPDDVYMSDHQNDDLETDYGVTDGNSENGFAISGDGTTEELPVPRVRSSNTESIFCQECEVHYESGMFLEHFEHLHGKPQEDPLKLANTEDKLETTFASGHGNASPNTGDTSLQCKRCPRKVPTERDLLVHNKLHKISPFHCYVCRSVHNSTTTLRNHIRRTHLTDQARARKNHTGEASLNVRKPVPGRLKGVKCSQCTLHISQANMQKHLKLHKESPHHCTECGNVFESARALEGHYAKYHRAIYLLRKQKRFQVSAASKLDDRVSKKKRSKKISDNTVKPSENSNFDEGDVDKFDIDGDWQPENSLNQSDDSSAPILSAGPSKAVNQVAKKRQGKKLICPFCKFFFCKAEAVENLMTHFEVCQGIQDDKDGDTRQDLTCPSCKNFKVPFAQQLAYCEHLLVCKENFGEDQLIPLTHRIFECTLCDPKQYFRVYNFIQHFMEHSRTGYKCTKCPKRFKFTSQVSLHWTKNHRDACKSVQALYRYTKQGPAVPNFPWWCTVCGEKFAEENSRDDHMFTCHERELPEKSHVCSKCSKAYSCDLELRLHEEVAHITDSLEVLDCDICNEQFKTPLSLRNHRMKIHRVDLMVCDVCGLECNSKHNLSNHMQLHAAVRNHVCQDCGDSFTTGQYLRDHIYRMHTPHDPKVNPAVCTFCGKIYKSKSYVDEHIARVHDKKYNFHCSICNLGTYSKANMRRHMANKHQIGKQKVFPCLVEGCNVKTDSPGQLKSHMTRHTGDPQFNCQYCGKAFHNKTHLRRHEQIHTNAESKPFQCEICSKCFPVRNYLYIHMKSHAKKS